MSNTRRFSKEQLKRLLMSEPHKVLPSCSTHRYTQRCQMIEEHGRLTSEEE
jgi:hypothetical protein